MTDEWSEGYAAAILGRPRNSNPYARGWSRSAALVMPDSLAARWDGGWKEGRDAAEKLAKIVNDAARKGA
jgi:ribosome modulation factor